MADFKLINRARFRILLLCGIMGIAAHAQARGAAPQFDAATVKVSDLPGRGVGSCGGGPDGGASRANRPGLLEMQRGKNEPTDRSRLRHRALQADPSRLDGERNIRRSCHRARRHKRGRFPRHAAAVAGTELSSWLSITKPGNLTSGNWQSRSRGSGSSPTPTP